LRLDRWLSGELSPSEEGELMVHIAGCSRCAAAAGALRASREEGLPPLAALESVRSAKAAQDVPRPRRRRWRGPVFAAGLAGALAAGVLLVVRPAPVPEPGIGIKGSGVAVTMYVQHDGEVRRSVPDEVVVPGDAIRFAVTTPVRSYVGVLSLDAKGHASVYFPLGPRAQPIGPGVEEPLPIGTRLDGTVGAERIWALFCSSPVELGPLRAQLEGGWESVSIPDGCRVSQWRFVKR
jgi:hypothetical protein